MLYVLMFLFLVTAPLLIFSVKPELSTQRRIWRILIATIIGYMLLNLILHTHRYLQWQEFEQCQNIYSKDPLNMADECKGIINIADGASNIFYLYLGWVPAVGYAGFFELLWRIKHRAFIKNMGKQFSGRWFSNFVVITAIPVWIFMLLIITLTVFMKFYCFIDFSNDKC
jgi:hypothetical protein